MGKTNLKKIFLLVLGLLFSIFPDIFDLNQGLSFDTKLSLRMVLLMIFLWLTEVIPLSMTALLPILFSPFCFDKYLLRN